MNTQFKKGVLELCVLVLLTKRDYYGYELVEKISQSIEITEGTIYPLLKRLKDDGYVSTYQVESASGATRKYYKVTEIGKKRTDSSSKEWSEFVKNVNNLLFEN